MKLDKLSQAYLDIKDREIEKLQRDRQKAIEKQVALQHGGQPASASISRHIQNLTAKIAETENDRQLLEARLVAGLTPGLRLGRLHSIIPRPTLNALAKLRKSLPATKTTEG